MLGKYSTEFSKKEKLPNQNDLEVKSYNTNETNGDINLSNENFKEITHTQYDALQSIIHQIK